MKTRTFPLSDSQLGLYYEWQKDKSLTQYNIAFLYEFPDPADPVRLKRSFEKVVSAHPGMKVRLKRVGDEVVQYIDANDAPRVSYKKVREQEMKRIINGFIRPVNLLGSPLYRIEMYQTEKKLYALFAIHHIIFDGYSTEIFHSDLARAYSGEELAEEAYTVCDHTATEQGRNESEAYREAEAWFEKRLNGITMTKVPMVSTRKSETGYRQISIERINRDAVNDFCTRNGISPNNLFAGALGICLNRYTREETIAFCTAHHGRIDDQLEKSTGMFVKTLPVVMTIASAQSVGEYLAGIRTDMKELWSRQIFPFSEMVKKSGISMDISYTFQKGFPENLDIEGLPVEIQFLRTVRTQETLSVYIYQKSSEYEIRCEYNDSLYDHEYIRSFTAAIKNLAMNMMEDNQRNIGALPLLDAGQEAIVHKMSMGKTHDHDRTRSLVDLFREQVTANPDRIAVVFDDKRLTYLELDHITDRIAKKLLSLGVTREEAIGIMTDRNEYMVIYPLSVIKAGCAYMPLDYTMPSDRLDFMVRDAGARLILSEGSRVAEHLPSFEGTVIRTEEIYTFHDMPEMVMPKPAPEDLFVLLYTSGSTGTPKGCMVEHRNVVNFVKWYSGELRITPEDKSIAYANFAFDAHMIDIYPMITSGAEVYILPSDMRLDIMRINQYMEDNGITIAFLTTQIGRQFAEDIENHTLRALSVGGERLIPTKKPPYAFYNLYGPTEITICSTFYNIEHDYNSSVIGRSVDNVSNYILDQNLHLLPPGVAGELCIGGEGVTRDYLNREELTREKFILWKGMRLYRSGDLARYNEAGEIEYISRLDNQVKLRGLRIELGEIENVMSGYNGITSTVVDVKEIGGVQHLIGYFTSRNEIDTGVLKDFLRERLTEFMIPTALIRMEKFPMTSNGKVNRKLLPVPSIVAEEIVAPASPMEQDLFAIVAELLKSQDFGATTNLFSLGLTSILAIKLSVIIQKRLGIVIQTKDILRLKTIRNLAGLAEKQAGTDLTMQPTAFEKQNWYPLTENQLGLYYDWEKNREGLQYNIGASLRFSAHVDVRQLKDAAIAVIEAHPYLKTTLAIRENQVVQLRRDDLPVDILTNQVDEVQMESVLSSFVRPFNLFGDTLYRFAIHQTELYTYFLFDIHHIIFDGTSMSILFNDLKEAFEGKFLTSEGFTAFDRALEEKAITSTQKYTEAEVYFDNLIGKTTLTAFPSLLQTPSVGSAKNVVHSFRSEVVKAFCTGNAVTESNFLMAAFFLVLSRYTREDRVAITSVSSGREENHLSGLMGMFVKTFPVIADLKSLSVLGLVKAIQEQVYTTMEHDIFPFTKMAGKYGITPQVNFVFQGGIDTELKLGQERVRVNFLHVDTVKFPLCAVIFPGPEGYTLTLEFDDALYQEPDIRRFATIYAETVLLMTAHANTPLEELCLATGSMKERVMQVSLGKQLEHDRSLSLVDLFRQQAARTPDNIAVVFKQKKYSYREIDRLTDRIAAMLVASGVDREIPVGVMIDRSEYMAIFPMAVMKAGGAYMPLDFTMPHDRLDFMVRDAGVRHIVSEGKRVAECLPGFDGLVINREDIPAPENEKEVTLPKPAPEDMFVILYTSGSTGTPKGCILEHRNIVNFCRWYVEDFNVTPQDRSVAYANFAFDAHMMDIYPMITSGASVYILPSEMRMDIMEMNRYMEENGLTIAFMTTQVGRQFAEDIENRSLRLLSVGGERLLPTKKPPYRFYNGYGPTECTLYSTFYNIEKDYNSSVIGHSLANVANYIMDQHRQLLPLGVAGELCIGGKGVGRGYLNRDDLNREKFVRWNGQTLYRSGDLARYNEEGEIEYISRLDNQVKLRGLRIELGEIENAITGFEGVSAAVVDIKEIAGLQQLCGYYIAKSRIAPEALKEHLSASLTKYMVPTALIQMDHFPLTNNGKVNRKALPIPELERTSPYIAPENEVEKQICMVFSNILKTEKVGVLDSFFEIGGSSMTAIKAIIRIINLGYSIQYGDLFKLKTPREVARFVTALTAAEKGEEVPLEDISAYDYSAINRILQNAKPALWEDYRPSHPGDVLLTGSTGYLGIHVLRELIRSETGKIYCMVRSKGALSPDKRLQTLLMYYFSDGFDELFDTRIIPVNGDITSLNMLKLLRGKGISTVFNCAASVKHFSAGDELQKINVDGVANLVGFCSAENARLVHVSTQSICGFTDKEISGRTLKIDETRLYVGQMIDNVYAMSKFKAERIVLQAVAEGLDGKIMRVGNLMGRHADGEFQVNFRSNAFMNTLKAYKVLKMFPLSQLVTPLEMSPVDYTAASIVSLSATPKEVVICHPYNNYRLNMASVIYSMKQYGFELSLVSDSAFNDHFNETMQDPRKSEYLSGLLHYRVGENYIETPDDNDYTSTLLYMNGIRWPLVGDDYALRLIGFLDGMGFFDEN